ncbi:MAG: hypothetical protein RL398_1747 [Planctomycetota bacterium]
MSTQHVRPARADDFAAIASICNHYIANTTIHFGADAVTAEQLRDEWRGDAHRFPWWVAISDDHVVGYAKAGTFRARAAYRWTVETGIYMAPDCVGRGLGTPLYVRLLDTLRSQGYRAAIGGITLPNPGSIRLHERLGFTHEGTLRAIGFKHGRWIDVGFWRLGLASDQSAPGEIRSPAAVYAAAGIDAAGVD